MYAKQICVLELDKPPATEIDFLVPTSNDSGKWQSNHKKNTHFPVPGLHTVGHFLTLKGLFPDSSIIFLCY